MTWLLKEFEPRSIPASAITHQDGRRLWHQYDQNGKRLLVEFPGIPTDNQWRLTNQGFAGHIALPDGPQIQLEPKVPLHNLFQLIDTAYDLNSFQWLEGWSRCATLAGYFDQLAAYLAAAIARRRRQGLYLNYQERHDTLPYIRGRIDLPKLLARPRSPTVPSDFSEATIDNQENQLLLWTLHTLVRSGLARSDTQAALKRTLRSLAGVSFVSFPASACHDRTYNRLNHDYAPLHHLCGLFLASLSPNGLAGEVPLPAFLVNMAELFERFVFRWLAQTLPADYDLRAQETVHLDDGGRHRFELDLVLRRQGALTAVLDTKYKRPDYGPSTQDIAQVIAYAQATGSDQAFLIYPTPLAEPLNTRIGSVTLRTIHFDLSERVEPAGTSFLNQLLA